MVAVDSETLFNAAAAMIGTVAVLLFLFNVDLGHSPVSEMALVVLFCAVVFAVSQRADDYQVRLFGYAVVVTAVVALFFEVASVFDVGDTGTVVGLLAIATALLFLRTRLDADHRFVTGRQATAAVGVLVALVALLVVVDVVTGGLAYELRPESQVEFSGDRHGEVRVASVVVTNPTPLPERVETPRYEVCAAGDWSEFRPSSPDAERRGVSLHANVQDGYDEHVFGYGTKTYPVSMYVDAANVTGETFPVRTTSDCPDEESGPPYVALFEVPEEPVGGVRAV